MISALSLLLKLPRIEPDMLKSVILAHFHFFALEVRKHIGGLKSKNSIKLPAFQCNAVLSERIFVRARQKTQVYYCIPRLFNAD